MVAVAQLVGVMSVELLQASHHMLTRDAEDGASGIVDAQDGEWALFDENQRQWVRV